MAAVREGSAASAARRAQIIDATIETVAELGFAQTTFARIAERGGLSSTRLISYHFQGKAELMQAVVDDIYRSINAFLLDRADVDPASRPIVRPAGRPDLSPPESAPAELRAYITGVVAYIGAHRSRMRAIRSISAAVYDEPGNPAVGQADPQSPVMSHLQGLLRRGQADGAFRTFDPLVLAAMVQQSLEGLPLLLQNRPDLDLKQYAAELVAAVDLATRRSNPFPAVQKPAWP
jgi:AcrR family transcriptional regulator